MVRVQGVVLNFDGLSDKEFAEFLFRQRQRWIAEANQLEIDYWWPLLQEEDHV